MVNCVICHEEIEEKYFGRHVNSEHKLTLARYHSENFPRFDLYTNEPIKYDNLEQYYTTFYLNKDNLKNHLSSIPVDQAAQICIDMFSARKQYKKEIFAPSQTECRSTNLPAPTLFHKLGLDYNLICKAANFKERFTYDIKLNYLNKNIAYACDNREKKPLPLPIKLTKKLDYGDYVSNYNPYKIYIERKSATDLAGTICGNLKRFEREIVRAAKDDAYLMIVCEDNIDNLMTFEKQPYSKHSYVKGFYLFHLIRELTQKYSNIQFLFCSGRLHMISVIEKIYRCEYNPRRIDFQYFIDKRII